MGIPQISQGKSILHTKKPRKESKKNISNLRKKGGILVFFVTFLNKEERKFVAFLDFKGNFP